MPTHIAIPMLNGRWLVLDEASFAAGLVAGQELDANVGLESVKRAEARALLTAEETARVLGVDANWLLIRARRREVPFVKLGKYVRFDPQAVIAHCAKATDR